MSRLPFLLLACGILLGIPPAFGCSCMKPGLPCEQVRGSSAVFAGRVSAIALVMGDRGRSAVSVHFALEESFEGIDTPRKEIDVRTGRNGADCGYGFEPGKSYFVYANKSPDGALHTSICTRTRPVEQAAEDLEYFHGFTGASNAGQISGTICDAQKPGRPGVRGCDGMGGVRVVIAGKDVHREAQTSSDGRFRFEGLASGEYSVTPSLSDYAAIPPSQTLDIGTKGCAQLSATMKVDRRIRGRVLDQSGKPGEQITVQALQSMSGQENPVPQIEHWGYTNARGEYEIPNLDPGDFYVGISLDRSPTPAYPYGRFFYPGTPDRSSAGLVHLANGPNVQDRVNFTLPPRQHGRALDGLVVWPDGRPAEKVWICVEDPEWPLQTFAFAPQGQTDAQGRFRITVLDLTRYRIHAITTATEQAVSAEPLLLEPGRASKDPLRLVLIRPGNSVLEMRQRATQH